MTYNVFGGTLSLNQSMNLCRCFTYKCTIITVYEIYLGVFDCFYAVQVVITNSAYLYSIYLILGLSLCYHCLTRGSG